MIGTFLKSKIIWIFPIALFTVLLSPLIAQASELPSIEYVYGNDTRYISHEDYTEQYAIYTGKEIRPKVDFRLPYYISALTEGRDYTLSYSNNTNTGFATVTAKGIGTYSGQSSFRFEIVKSININKFAKDERFYLKKNKYKYSGKPIRPQLSYPNYELKEGIDYVIAYSNNINPGKGSVVITGIGAYSGSITKTFTIQRRTSLKIKNVYGGTKKIICDIAYPVVGDRVKLKLGKKTYTKKIKKFSSKVRLTFKVPRQKFGTKYTISIRSKKGTLIDIRKSKVWYTNKLRTGQTATQVKLNPNWGTPSYKNVYSGYSGRQETWVYDWYDSSGNWEGATHLYFRNGILRGWDVY